VFERATFHYIIKTVDERYAVANDNNHGKNLKHHPIFMPKEWVFQNAENISEGQIQELEENHRQGIHQWIELNPGSLAKIRPNPQRQQDPSQCMAASVAPTAVCPTGPPIRYAMAHHEHKCMPNSFCSALHDAGYAEEAKALHSHSTQDIRFDTKFTFRFINGINKVMGSQHGMRVYSTAGYDKGALDFPRDCLVLLKLKCLGGRINHCVTVYDGHIYDASFKRAWPLSLESFQCIVGEHLTFNGFFRAWVLKKRQTPSVFLFW
jgi:hypothetical protein